MKANHEKTVTEPFEIDDRTARELAILLGGTVSGGIAGGLTGLAVQEKNTEDRQSAPMRNSSGFGGRAERPAGSIDPKLLEILVCPLTKGTLEYDAEKQELISRSAKLAYPIRDGIPIMLPEEARRLE
jgi:uncharacterized protein